VRTPKPNLGNYVLSEPRDVEKTVQKFLFLRRPCNCSAESYAVAVSTPALYLVGRVFESRWAVLTEVCCVDFILLSHPVKRRCLTCAVVTASDKNHSYGAGFFLEDVASGGSKVLRNVCILPHPYPTYQPTRPRLQSSQPYVTSCATLIVNIRCTRALIDGQLLLYVPRFRVLWPVPILNLLPKL
jgi:hypothetical protein